MEGWRIEEMGWSGIKGEALFANEQSIIFNRTEVVIFEVENGQIDFPVGSDFDSIGYRVAVQLVCSNILLSMIAQQSGNNSIYLPYLNHTRLCGDIFCLMNFWWHMHVKSYNACNYVHYLFL